MGHRDTHADQVPEPAVDDISLVAEAAAGVVAALHANSGEEQDHLRFDFPVLRMQRVVPEALALDLPADVLDNYLYNNAAEFFLGENRES